MDIRLACVNCGKTRKHPAGTVYKGQPVDQWFAARGRLCSVCIAWVKNTPGGYRATDPPTSRAGAMSIFGRAGKLRSLLMEAWVSSSPAPLTDYEATVKAGLREGAWKRASELRGSGVIVPTGQTRINPNTGVPNGLSEVTSLGHKLWQHYSTP